MAGYLAGNVDEWIYIDIQDQHEDSIRFIKDCEKKKIDCTLHRSQKHYTIGYLADMQSAV